MKNMRDFAGFGDSIVLHAWRPNSDGSITCEGTVIVEGPDGTQWTRSAVRLRLEPEDADSAAWARRARRSGAAALRTEGPSHG